MTLGDVVAGWGLHTWAEVALIAFFAAFIAIVLSTLRRANRESYEHARRMPLHDDGGTPASSRPAHDPGSDR